MVVFSPALPGASRRAPSRGEAAGASHEEVHTKLRLSRSPF